MYSNENNKFCNSLFSYSRFISREVKIGDLYLGNSHPIRLQSMTTTDTMDTIKTVEQSIRMIEAGSEIVRITAPSINEAKNLELIKNELRKRGYNTPICADIHFTPNAAEFAARVVEKVRVNPGNYADKKKFEQHDYSDSSYEAELERIRKKFTPLVAICKEYGTAMRIGTNHGSLSDRILSRYGDTPLGMVESALEFVRICEENNFHAIVLSMKASNPQVMVQAYRLLVNKMLAEGMNYPLHLGVTEAGDGEDGRIKSAVGIGTLLEDGLGDTIRVSLTEEPEFEIPVARILAERYSKRISVKNIDDEISSPLSSFYSPFTYERRNTREVISIGKSQVPRVIADLSDKNEITQASLFAYGYHYAVQTDKWNLSDQAVDFIYTGNTSVDFEIPGTLGVIYNTEKWKQHSLKERTYPLFCAEEFIRATETHPHLNFVAVDVASLNENFVQSISKFKNVVLIADTLCENAFQDLRSLFLLLKKYNCDLPTFIKRNFVNLNDQQFQLFAATDVGEIGRAHV